MHAVNEIRYEPFDKSTKETKGWSLLSENLIQD